MTRVSITLLIVNVDIFQSRLRVGLAAMLSSRVRANKTWKMSEKLLTGAIEPVRSVSCYFYNNQLLPSPLIVVFEK